MSNQVPIALVVPYFGKFPNYFNLWLKTAAFQKDLIDFLVFTDCDTNALEIPKNVKVIKTNYQEVGNTVNRILPFKVKMYSPYKITDYKPLYGLIFQDYLKEYDFWGFCDVDLVWGKLSNFVTEKVLSKYDRIYNRGHLEIFRNIPSITNAVLNDYLIYHNLQDTMGVSIKDIFGHSYAAHFDEGPHLQTILTQPKINAKCYIHYDMADILSDKKQFICLDPVSESRQEFAYFKWENGILTGFARNGSPKEFAYAHLQKRNMTKMITGDPSSFLIIPNQFIDTPSKVTSEMIRNWCVADKKYEKEKKLYFVKLRIKHIFNGGGILRLKEKVHSFTQ